MFIFEKAPFAQCHASTVVEHEPGKLMAAWFGGAREGAKDVQIWASTFDGKAWGELIVLGTEPGQPCWNPVLFALPDGLRLWYKAGPDPQNWTGFVRRLDGTEWTPPEMLPAGQYGPVRAKPILLKNGTLLAGTSVESHRRNWVPYVDRSTDHGKTWTRSNAFHVPGKFKQIQPTLFVGADDAIVALTRSGDPLNVCRSVSRDGGATFTPAEPTALGNPSSGIDALRTRAGDVFLIYNPSALARSPLSLARSTDDGKTWTKVLDLETELGEFSYPAMIESAAGTLEVTYTWKRDAHQAPVPRPDQVAGLTLPVRLDQLSHLAVVRGLARLLDNAFTIPGTNVKVGADAILGLIPGVGDASSSGIGAYLLWVGAKLGVPKAVLWRMGFNLVADAALGLIPFVGDAIDVGYRVNAKNAALLERAVADPRTTGRSSTALLVGVGLAALTLFAGGLVLSGFAVWWMWQRLSAG